MSTLIKQYKGIFIYQRSDGNYYYHGSVFRFPSIFATQGSINEMLERPDAAISGSHGIIYAQERLSCAK